MTIGERRLTGEKSIDFLKLWKKGLLLSAVLVIASVASLAVSGLNYGIDFEGGIAWEVKAPGVSVDETRDALEPLGLGEVKIQTVGEDVIRVQAGTDAADQEAEVADTLAELAGTERTEVSIAEVGPSWGDEITAAAVRALVWFFLVILGYLSLRLEWRMAVGALVAVTHDILISAGVYSIFQFEVTPATVISFLTILGYSIYDTIVVFDKVQENAAKPSLTARMTYPEMMNLSMNQVLLRSINTTVSSLIPVLCVLIIGSGVLGVTTLRDFSLALAVGLTAGAYSSIFVAAPVVAWLKARDPNTRQRTGTRTSTARRTPSTSTAASRSTTSSTDEADVAVDQATPDTPITPRAATPKARKKKRR